MLQQLKDRISDVSSLGSIEVQIDSTGELLLNWIVLSKKKQVLVIEKSGTLKAADFHTLVTCIPTSMPVVFSLTGKGILHKKIQQQGGDKGKLFDYIFPNARIDDYVVQYLLCTDNSFYVSVIRKDQVERVVTEVSGLGYDILSLSLGPFALLPLLIITEYNNTSLIAGRHQLAFEKQAPVEYMYSNEINTTDVDIAGNKIASQFLVAYANGFQYLVKGLERVEVAYPLLESGRKNYEEKKLFKVLSLGGLIFFFSLLILNTIAYSSLSEKNNALSSEYGSLQNVALSNKKNTEEFNQKESFLSKSGWLNPAAISYYSDRIAASLPGSIQLTRLSVYPVDESATRKEKKEIFSTNSISVEGISGNPTDLNNWMKRLNELKWITQVKVQDYKFDPKTNKGNF